MKNQFVLLIVLAALTGCNFSKSVKKDLTSGLLTMGDGLSCENVYLSVNDEATKETTFIYGSTFKMIFENITGFQKEGEGVFPGMRIIVTSNTADTVFQTNDLYGEKSYRINLSPLLLSATVTAAAPIHSGAEYVLAVYIWDKKGKGVFSGKVDFKVVPNGNIKIEAEKVTFNEIYLFSRERNSVIPDNKIKSSENTYLIFEGLDGFKVENGMVFPGLTMSLTDSDNNNILENQDLFLEYSEKGLALADFNSRVASNFILNDTKVKNPLHLVLTIWDKKSDVKITAKADLVAE